MWRGSRPAPTDQGPVDSRRTTAGTREGRTAMTAQAEWGSGSQGMVEMWEAGQRALMEGWRQGQEFWNNAARGWGEIGRTGIAGASSPGAGGTGEAAKVMRELQEAAIAAGTAWMRLPLALAAGAPPAELQEA